LKILFDEEVVLAKRLLLGAGSQRSAILKKRMLYAHKLQGEEIGPGGGINSHFKFRLLKVDDSIMAASIHPLLHTVIQGRV
jgi:hypothetical protein